MLLLLACYFVTAVAVLALAVFPDLRRGLMRTFTVRARALGQGADRVLLQAGQRAEGARTALGGALYRLWRRVCAYRWWIAGSTAAVALPSMLAFFLRHNHTFDYIDVARGPDARIQALLSGEQLVPPAPPPPAAFTTREVTLVRPHLVGASRDWDLLDAEFRQRLLMVFHIMREQHGYEMALLEGYRSPERQEQLAAKGGHVTNARAYQSYHQFGLAADAAFFRDGKLVISEKDPWAMRGYELYGEAAEMMGLTWGGRWKMMDFGHVELRRPGTLRRPASGGQE